VAAARWNGLRPPRYRPGFHFSATRSVQTPPDRAYIGHIVEWMNATPTWCGRALGDARLDAGLVRHGADGQVLGEGGPVALGVFLDHDEAMRWLRDGAESRSD